MSDGKTAPSEEVVKDWVEYLTRTSPTFFNWMKGISDNFSRRPTSIRDRKEQENKPERDIFDGYKSPWKVTYDPKTGQPFVSFGDIVIGLAKHVSVNWDADRKYPILKLEIVVPGLVIEGRSDGR